MNLDLTNIENALIICPNDYKNKLLEAFGNEHKIIDANFLTIEEYSRNYYFDYGIDAIEYLVNEGLSKENAEEILNNICYVENKFYNNYRLDKLVEYKNKLDENNLLIYNKLFKQYISNKNVVVIGYGKLNKSVENIIEGKTVTLIEDEFNDRNYIINKFVDIDNEVEYVYNSIYDLLEEGVDINNIYIANAGKDYESYIKKYNRYYGFKVEENSNLCIIGTSLAKSFISMLDSNTREEIYSYLDSFDNNVSKKLQNILNKYVGYELKDVKDLIIDDLTKTRINNDYKNIVRNVNLESKFEDSDYVFVLGFNDSVPSIEVDTDYITNNIKPLVNLETSEERNVIKKRNLRTSLSNIKNLTLTYCESSPFNVYNKQTLIPEDKCAYVVRDNSYSYSDDLNKEKLSSYLDDLRKFNNINQDIDKLFNTYGKNDYLKYNNKFKGLSDNQISNLISQINTKNDKLTLSYSSINSFYECNFKYYMESVLKVKEPFGTYYTRLGTVCHGVLQDLYSNPNFDFEQAWNSQILKEEEKEGKPIFEVESEKYFVQRIKEELKQDIEIVNKQKANSLLNNIKCENYFSHDVTDRIKFIGFVDKLMFKETDNQIIASVVDYKTSKSIEIDKEIMKYGLSLQLPSYLYLIKHAPDFNKEVKVAGLYIQHIINYDKKYKNEETNLNQNKQESMKLDGISSSNPELLSSLDISLNASSKSETIKGVSLNKDGSLKKSVKLYTDEQFDELSKLVEDNIKYAGETILSGDFSINPKVIDNANKSCEYCKYAPICYKRSSNNKYLSKKEEQ